MRILEVGDISRRSKPDNIRENEHRGMASRSMDIERVWII